MKKSFEPIKLRENSRKRVLRELISYNEAKGKTENSSKDFSDSISTGNKSQRELKPHKKKKASIVMEVLAGAAVIAMIAGGIAISVNKSGNNPIQPLSKNNYTENSSKSDSSLQDSLPAAPMVEFISSEKLGASIILNKKYFSGYEIASDGSILLYQNDYGTETGFNYNCIEVSASTLTFEEALATQENLIDDYYVLSKTENVLIGHLQFDYLANTDVHSVYSSGISATKLLCSYDLPDLNVTECKEIYIIDSHTYSDTYGAYIITATYRITHDEEGIQYSTEPEVIYDIIDTFSFVTYAKKTIYILPKNNYVSDNSMDDGSSLVNFCREYTTDVDNDESNNSFYSILASSDAGGTNADFSITLPVGHLYDVSGTKDTDLNEDFYSTFDDSVAIDLYYSYYEGSYDGSEIANIYPSYGVLYSEFKTDSTNVPNNNDDTEKSTMTTDDVIATKSFKIFPQDDKLVSVGDKYITIYGISEEFEKQLAESQQSANDNTETFDFDYVIYVPIEKLYDENGNSFGHVIADIINAEPSLTMTVHYDEFEFETFPVQIYANEVIIYGLETTNIYN